MALEIYTTTALTRVEAGFENNADVTDPNIEQYVKGANGEVGMAVAARYNTPLTGSTFVGSNAESYLRQIATSLAAGNLLLREYEGQGGDMADFALAKVSWARKQLDRLSMGKMRLIGVDGMEFAKQSATTGGAHGTPDGLTDTNACFTMGDRF